MGSDGRVVAPRLRPRPRLLRQKQADEGVACRWPGFPRQLEATTSLETVAFVRAAAKTPGRIGHSAGRVGSLRRVLLAGRCGNDPARIVCSAPAFSRGSLNPSSGRREVECEHVAAAHDSVVTGRSKLLAVNSLRVPGPFAKPRPRVACRDQARSYRRFQRAPEPFVERI